MTETMDEMSDRLGKLQEKWSENARKSASPELTQRYAPLLAVLDEAFRQAAIGKGDERHAQGLPFDQQPILRIARQAGHGFPAGQALKKTEEALGMMGRGESAAAIREWLGAIVYLAAAVISVREAG